MAERARNHTRFSTQLADLTDLERVQAAKDVAVTMETPGWGLVVGLLEGRRARLLDELVHHELVRSEAEYACRLARVDEIDVALDAAVTVLHVGERSAQRLTEKVGGG